MFEALVSSTTLLVCLVLAIFVTFAAIRETRKKYVPATSVVIQEFSIQTEVSQGQPYVHIVGRHRGVLSWLLTSLGIDNKIELKVTDKDWTLRSASLAGMITDYHPLKNLSATICGYQRSTAALFFSICFALAATATLLGAVSKLPLLLVNHSESEVEASASGISVTLASTLLWMILWGIAFLIFYTSKRVSFGVEADGGRHGILFKRSLIGNKVIDLSDAEHATCLINQLFAAAVYGVPTTQIPRQPITDSSLPGVRTPWGWIAGATYLGLFVLSLVLRWYGNGVNVQVTTTPLGVPVVVDDKFAGFTTKETNLITLPHTTREDHTFTAQLPGYEPLKETFHIGGFRSTQDVTLRLTPLKYSVTFSTSPAGARVVLDGKDAGVTDTSTSQITIPDIEAGMHQITVSAEGYRPYTDSIQIVPGQRHLRVTLVNEAEAKQQEAQSRQLETAAHLDRARMFFTQGQYQQALDECDSVLKIDPINSAAAALKTQIEQTRKVLGQ